MKIVSLLRVKNGERYLPRLFRQLKKISDVILVLDDGSTDATPQVCKGCEVDGYRKYDREFNGGRDRIELHEWAKEYSPNWIISLDADELFEEEREEYIRDLLEHSPETVRSWSFPFFYLWNDETHYRIDDGYREVWANRIFRYNPDWKPRDVVSHSTASPTEVLGGDVLEYSSIRIKHFGYMSEQERQVKYNYYIKRDADPLKAGAGSDSYEHIVQEDVVLLPWQPETKSICFLPAHPLFTFSNQIEGLKKLFPEASEFVIGNSNLDEAGRYLVKGFCRDTLNTKYVDVPFEKDAMDECFKKAAGHKLVFIDIEADRISIETTKEEWLKSKWKTK